MTTRDVLEKIMRGKKSAKKAFEDFCEQEHVNGIIVLTAHRSVILLKDEFANKFITGGSKGNGIVLTTGNMQFYKGYEGIEDSIAAGLFIIHNKYDMMIQLGGTVSYNGDAQYSILESSLNIKRAIENKKECREKYESLEERIEILEQKPMKLVDKFAMAIIGALGVGVGGWILLRIGVQTK